ncbi:MAG: class I adenylate-forming enzyme family protein [Solirubrobacteraceae bacterium]
MGGEQADRPVFSNGTMFPNGIDAERAAEYRRRGWWTDMMLADHVARHAAEIGERAAFITPDGRLSWSDYDACSDRLARALSSAGLAHGDRVAIQLPDAATVHVALLACEKAGVVAVGVGSRAGDRELRHLLHKTRAGALVSHEEHRGSSMSEAYARLRGEVPSLRHHVVVPRFELDRGGPIVIDGAAVDADMQGGSGAGARADADAQGGPAGPAAARRRLGPEDLWMINSTSGTTGLPKCVMHAQSRWWYFHLCATEMAALTPQDVVMGAVPTPFGFGQWTSHFTPCYLGAPTVVMERFSAALTLELIERERVSVLCAVSTQFRMLLGDPAIHERDVSSLRVMFTGGEAIPYEPASRFEELTGARILNVYGSNESGFATGTRLTDDRERRLRTAGRVMAGTELRLYDAGVEVTGTRRGQPGTRGPAMCLGYFEDPAANEELFTRDGFVLHADVVELDEDGYLSVVGRKSDIIIRGGKNISAPQVEEEVSAHPRVTLASAVAIPDEIFGERVCVYVELLDHGELELAELVEFLISHGTSKECLPERLVVVDEIPRSSGGKIAKGALREAAAKLVGD